MAFEADVLRAVRDILKLVREIRTDIKAIRRAVDPSSATEPEPQTRKKDPRALYKTG